MSIYIFINLSTFYLCHYLHMYVIIRIKITTFNLLHRISYNMCNYKNS